MNPQCPATPGGAFATLAIFDASGERRDAVAQEFSVNSDTGGTINRNVNDIVWNFSIDALPLLVASFSMFGALRKRRKA